MKQRVYKRALCLMLTIAMVIGVFPMMALAAANNTVDGISVVGGEIRKLNEMTYVVDAAENNITISKSGILIDAFTCRFGRNSISIEFPSTYDKSFFEDVKGLFPGVTLDGYDNFSYLACYDDDDKYDMDEMSAIILVRWKDTTPPLPEFNLAGEGTEASPYLIESTDNLSLISQYVERKNDFSGKYFKLEQDVTLPEDWTPIGSNKVKFAGTFDGNNHTVTVAKEGLPLFGLINKATIKNLNIYGEHIKGYGLVNNYTTGVKALIENVTIKSGSKILYSGLIGGYGNDSVDIVNCTVERNVVIGDDGSWGDIADATYPYSFVGTMNGRDCIGSFAGAWNGTMTGCVSYATVYGRNNVGGLVGFKGQSMRDFYINDCAFYGQVIASGTAVGGIVGNGYTAASAPNSPCVNIENCAVVGNVTGKDSVGGILGGELGVTNCWGNGIGRIRNNYFAGTVAATDGENVGGVIGFMKSLDIYNHIQDNFFVDNCGTNKGIGGVASIYDINYDLYSGYLTYGRQDDPLGADAEKLAKAVSQSALTDGSLVALLNAGNYGGTVWAQGEKAPVVSNTEKYITFVVSKEYGSAWLESSNAATVTEASAANLAAGKYIVVNYSDGSKEKLAASVGEISGIDFSKTGIQLATYSYAGYDLQFGVNVSDGKAMTKEGVVYVNILGYTPSDSEEVTHTLKNDNYVKWCSNKKTNLYNTYSLMDVIVNACSSSSITPSNPGGKQIKALKKGNVKLVNQENVKDGCWLISVNGELVTGDLSQIHPTADDVITVFYSDDPKADGLTFTGWKQDETTGNMTYYIKDELATGWVEIDGAWYYFMPETGYLNVKARRTIAGVCYSFNSDGSLAAGTWYKHRNGMRYYYAGVQYFGWQEIEGKTYFFNEKGYMVTGLVENEGVKYNFDENGVLIGKAEVVTDGWTTEGKDTFYLEDGVKVEGWKEIDGAWYYFLPETGALNVKAKRTIAGVCYSFDTTTHAAINDGGVWYEHKNGTRYYLRGEQFKGGEYVIDGETYMFNSKGYKMTRYQFAE